MKIVSQNKLDETLRAYYAKNDNDDLLTNKLDIIGGVITGSVGNMVTRLTNDNTNEGNIYSLFELKAGISHFEIATGPGVSGIATKSNNKLVFTTNNGVNTASMSIEAHGDVVVFKNFISNATTYLKNTFIDGILKTPQVETSKLKGGSSGIQILDSNNNILFEANNDSIKMSKSTNYN